MRRLLAVPLLLAGCSQRVYSPPARGFALETPRTLGVDQTAVQVAGGGGGAVFGPKLAVGDLSIRHGVRPDLDVVGDATWMAVTDASAAGTDPNIFAARGGVKYQPEGGPVALVVGGGAGYAPAGGPYVAADTALVVGWENCVVVPFLQAGVMASVPLDPRPVDVTQPDDKMPVLDTPSVTYGANVGVGLRVVLQHARCVAGLPSASIVTTGAMTQLWDNVHTKGDGFAALGFGVELPIN